MSNTSPNVFEPPTFDQPHVSYRKSLVDMFRATAEPEIRKTAGDIAAWQGEVNTLQGQMNMVNAKIADAQRYIGEIQHAVRGIEERADLPAVSLLPQVAEAQRHADAFGGPKTGVLMNLCGCGLPMEFDEKHGLVHRDEHGWVTAGDACKRAKDGTSLVPPTGDGVS